MQRTSHDRLAKVEARYSSRPRRYASKVMRDSVVAEALAGSLPVIVGLMMHEAAAIVAAFRADS